MEKWVIDHFRSKMDIEEQMAMLVALGVGIVHVNRCSKIGFALNRVHDFLDDCIQRIASGMPMSDFCASIDDYENPSIGIFAAPRTINAPYFIEVRPVSIGYNLADMITEVAKQADAKPKKKNALGFLDGLGKYSKFRRK